jgi:hypothetical protein
MGTAIALMCATQGMMPFALLPVTSMFFIFGLTCGAGQK